MSRIEKQAALEKQIQEVKEQVIQKKEPGTKSRKPWFTCLIILLVIFLLGASCLAWVVASTGLVSIPVFTNFAYAKPMPLREVAPGVPVETLLREQIAASLVQRFREGGRLLPSPKQTLEVSVPEDSLTATLRSKLEETPLEGLDISALQVTLEPDSGVEVFIPVEDSALQTAVVLFFDVIVKEGGIAVIPKDVFVGSAHVPSFLVAQFLTPLIEQRLAPLNEMIAGYLQISSADISSGKLLIKGTVSVER
jgi:hypothetical protein